MDCARTRGDDWSARAACRSTDLDALFVQGAAQNRAKAICVGCGVRTECLADALDNRVEFGVWGGMTERERRALLRRRPDVTNWRLLLESALADYQADYQAEYQADYQTDYQTDYQDYQEADVSALGA